MKNFRKALLGVAVSSLMLVGCGETNKIETPNQENELTSEITLSILSMDFSLDDYKNNIKNINGEDYYAISLNEYAKENIPNKDIYINAMDYLGNMHGFEVSSAEEVYVLFGKTSNENPPSYPSIYANNEMVDFVYRLYVENNPFKNTVKGEISIASYGVMEFELYPNVAPTSVANFTKLAKDGFYDGMIIHRIADLGGAGSDYIIQGGGFESGAYQYNKDTKPANTIIGEFLANGFYNALNHSRGVIAMARANAKNSASSQFYFVVDGCSYLDNNYATFGKVTSNLEVLDKLASVEVDDNYNWPTNEIQIEYIKIK